MRRFPRRVPVWLRSVLHQAVLAGNVVAADLLLSPSFIFLAPFCSPVFFLKSWGRMTWSFAPDLHTLALFPPRCDAPPPLRAPA